MISFITPSHSPTYLKETYESLLVQTTQTWEWVLCPTAEHTAYCMDNFSQDARVTIKTQPEQLATCGIGAIKLWSFMQGAGDYLAELDHDDLLTPTAAEDIEAAFVSTGADFVYSNAADFFPNGNGHWFPDWQSNGWRYRDTTIGKSWYNECLSFSPSAASVSLIYYAPNHIRVWKKEFYQKIGGHNPNYKIADDHELCVRTYLQGKMHHLDKLLYLYRMGDNNTFSKNLGEIRNLTNELYVNNIERLILREGELTGKACYDLGGRFNCPPGWKSVDLKDGDVTCDLNERWPWEDSSVLAFRAHDIIEHLKDKQHVMREAHRCLVPGGWLLIQVPSTDGRGAFQDPTHISYWNINSFLYYTHPEQAQYIDNTKEHFMESRLFDFYPSEWHKANKILYTKAELRAIKEPMEGVPGYRRFQ